MSLMVDLASPTFCWVLPLICCAMPSTCICSLPMALPTPSLTLPRTWLATPLILSVALPIVGRSADNLGRPQQQRLPLLWALAWPQNGLGIRAGVFVWDPIFREAQITPAGR